MPQFSNALSWSCGIVNHHTAHHDSNILGKLPPTSTRLLYLSILSLHVMLRLEAIGALLSSYDVLCLSVKCMMFDVSVLLYPEDPTHRAARMTKHSQCTQRIQYINWLEDKGTGLYLYISRHALYKFIGSLLGYYLIDKKIYDVFSTTPPCPSFHTEPDRRLFETITNWNLVQYTNSGHTYYW